MSYRPTSIPLGRGPEFKVWLTDELAKVSQAFEQLDNLDLVPLNAEPGKFAEGLIQYFDGVGFDPGFGSGPYYRGAASWIKMADQGGGGAVTSFAGRLGAVVPIVGDYAAFYAPLVHTHVEADITDLQAYLLDAPADGFDYGRRDNAWEIIPTSGLPTPTIPDSLLVSDGADFVENTNIILHDQTAAIIPGALVGNVLEIKDDVSGRSGLLLSVPGASENLLLYVDDATFRANILTQNLRISAPSGTEFLHVVRLAWISNNDHLAITDVTNGKLISTALLGGNLEILCDNGSHDLHMTFGTGIKITEKASAHPNTVGAGQIWTDSADGLLKYTTASGVEFDVTALGGGIADAPADGFDYGRRDNAWEIIEASQKDIYLNMSSIAFVFSEFFDPPGHGKVDGLQSIAAGAGAGSKVPTAAYDHTNHPGVWGLHTGATAAGRTFLLSAFSSTQHVGVGGITRFGCWFQVGAVLSVALDRYVLRAGWASMGLPNTIIEGICFEYQDDQNGGRWQGVCEDGIAETSIDTGVLAVVSTYYKLEIEINAAGTSVEFFIDDVSVGTIVTNIPAGTGFNLFNSIHIMKLTGTNNRVPYVDAWYCYNEVTR